jgi:hypothetical protein
MAGLKFVLIVIFRGSISMQSFNDIFSCEEAKAWIEKTSKESSAAFISARCATDLTEQALADEAAGKWRKR